MQKKSWIVWLAAILFFFTNCNKKSDSNPTPEPVQMTITSVFPAIAKGGETITIKGQNFLIDGQINKVLVNKSEASIISSSNDSVIVVVPQRAGSGTISVVTNTKTYTGSSFTYQYIVQVSTIAGTGNQGNNDGPALNATFKYPWGITVDNNGDIYIADMYNRLIRKIDATTKIVTSMSPGTLNFYSPYNITIDTISKSLYVTDFNAHLLKINFSGSMSVIFTDAGNGPLAGIGLGPDKRLYVSNNTTGEVLRFDTTGLNRTVFSVGLTTPRNIIFDKDGKMFVSGGGIYKMEANGNFSQVMPVSSRLRGWEIAMDSLGNFYEADYPNHCIRKIDKNGNAIVIAGNGTAADIDGIGLGASFNGPTGIAIDKEGSLYVTTHNFTTGSGNKVRKLTFY